ncbi:GldG family protein [Gammaproteobacteria bacterium AB-CW1]|uniref:GldG family protein n=1 Tax=Natronospira elongata TaxID=3110268 RepID=A0AAP6MKB8_9GAMM|nr:GldG family protein [Gammaproteobacteria bacterium AB-CW1]
MKIDRRTRWSNRVQQWTTVVLLLAVVIGLALLSHRYSTSFDWTHGARGSLSEPSRELLQTLEEPLRFTVFLGEDTALRDRVRTVVDRYRRAEDSIELRFVDPDREPAISREYGVTQPGQVFVEVGDQREEVDRFTEAGITNAIARAARASERYLVFTRGHGEADPLGEGGSDLGQLGNHLKERGLSVQRVNIARDGIPDNTAVLVIAGSQGNWMDGEIDHLRDYLDQGGNLVWLVDPHGSPPMALADHLGLGLAEGLVKDPSGRVLGIEDPGMILVFQYEDNPITGEIDAVTLIPHATMVDASGMDDWERQSMLRSSGESWLETLDGDRLSSGPMHLGQLLTRELETEGATLEQRVAVLGSQAALSNAYIGNGANLELGLRLFNWASADPVSLNVPVRSAPDRTLELSSTAYTVIGGFFLLLLPGLLLLAGGLIWWRRG